MHNTPPLPGDSNLNTVPLPQVPGQNATTQPFQRDPAPPSFGSGEHSQPPAQFGQSGGPVATPEQGGPALESDDKLALGVTFFVPGVGHILSGQIPKGIVIMLIVLVTLGLSWIVMMPAAMADLFLVIRAKKRREVGNFEFFPDYKEIL